MNSKDFPKKHLIIATITSPHGIKGLVNVKTFTKEPNDIVKYGNIFNEDGTKIFNLKIHSLKNNKLIAKIEGINDRNAAEEISNTKLYVLREALPETEENEFYIADLVDMDVVDKQDCMIGKVVHVHNFGGGDILEVKFDNRKNTEMILFSKENFPYIDLERKKICFVISDSLEERLQNQEKNT